MPLLGKTLPEEVKNADLFYDYNLFSLSDKLRLTDSSKREKGCSAAVDLIIKSISGETSFKIDRIVPAGSFKKGTALRDNYDIDIEYYVNANDVGDYVRHQKSYGAEIMQILKCNKNIKNMKNDDEWVSFEFRGKKFDLLPAFNAYQGKNQSTEMQQREVIQIISTGYPGLKDEELAKIMSYSLSESVVEFVRQQDVLVKKGIVFAKYWRWKKLPADIGLKSYTLELIVIHLAKKLNLEGNQRNKKLKTLFEMFLETLYEIDKVDIVFKPVSGYPRTAGSGDDYLPRIVGPIEPYDNLGKCIEESKFSLIKDLAGASLQRYRKDELENDERKKDKKREKREEKRKATKKSPSN